METFFTKQLKKIMAEKGFSQKELADKLNVTSVFISNYLKGKRNPKPATLYKFAKVLNVPPSYFIEEIDLKIKELLELKNKLLVQK